MRPKRFVNIALFILESMFILGMAACAMGQIDKADSINGEGAQNSKNSICHKTAGT